MSELPEKAVVPESKQFGLKLYSTTPTGSVDANKIDINDFFRFLEDKGLANPLRDPLRGLPPPDVVINKLDLKNPSSSLSVPPSEAALTNQADTNRPVSMTSHYGPGRALEIFNIDGVEFNEITFTPKDGKEVKLLFPSSNEIKAVLTPKTQEEFAQSYIHMLGLQQVIDEENKDIKWRNRLSSIIFKCTMSLILGYLYNHTKSYIMDFMFEKVSSSEEADEIGMMLIQSEIENGIMEYDDYAAHLDRLEFVRERVMKEGVVSQAFKEFAGIPKPTEIPIITNQTAADLSNTNNQTEVQEQGTTENYDHYYETIFEMVCRVGAQPLDETTEALSFSYARILKSVCSKICTILISYGVVSNAIMDKATPILEALKIVVDPSDDTTVFARLKAIIVLGVAYNSYGWLFAVVAPFAIPALINFTGWGIGFLARMPVKLISFAGRGVWGVGKWLATTDSSSRSVYTPPPQSDGSLICVGHTRRQIGEDPNDFALVPYLVSMNDINALTYEIMNSAIAKPSLASWFCDARGCADLDMQGDPINIAPFFKETNPIGNLLKCIDSEIMELTDDTHDSGIIKSMPEIVFSIFFNTIIQEDNNNGSLIGPVFSFVAETIHEAISAVREGGIGTVKAIVNEGLLGKDAIIMATNDSDTETVSTLSSNSSINSAHSCISQITIVDIVNSPENRQITIDLRMKASQMKETGKGKFSLIHPKVPTQPPLSPVSSIGSVDSTSSDISLATLGSAITANSANSSTITFNSFEDDDIPASIKIQLNIAEVTNKLKDSTAQIGEALAQSEKTMQKIDEMIISAMTAPHSDFIVISVGEWILETTLGVVDYFSSKGGYRRRKGPILAQIKNQINNLGFIKPKLVRNKRKSKRYGPKKGTKKWRKRYGSRRGTKKVYRKRHNTHKKRK